MAFSAEYVYRILDKYSGPLARITRATAKFQDASLRASKSMGRMGGKLKGIGDQMAGFSTVIGGAAIAGSMFKFAQSASTMSDAMADVKRVTDLADPGLAMMQENLQRLGRYTGKSALGLASIAYEGGKLAITNDEMIGFVETVMKTATAFDMADQEAGRAIGSIRAKLGLTVESVNTLLQRVNYLADTTSATGSSMINIIERVSGTFSFLKMPKEAIAGWAAFADQVETSKELAASGLRMMFSKLMQQPKMLRKLLKDPKSAMTDFLKQMAKMDDIRRTEKVYKMFGEEAGRFVLKAVEKVDLLRETMDKAASDKALGSMDREFANVLKRSSTMAKRLKETFIDISRTIGRVFLNVFDKYSQRLFKTGQLILHFVKTHPGLIKVVGVMGALAVAIAAVVVPAGVLMSMIGAALPVLSAVAAAIGAITWPVLAIIGAFVAWGALWTAMLTKSAMFRQSLLNLFDAFSPILELVKQAIMLIGKGLAWAFGDSGDSVKTFADAVSYVINAVAALINILVKLVTWFPRLVMGGFEPVISTMRELDTMITGFGEKIESTITKFRGLGIGGTWEAIKGKIGLGAATDKATSRTDNKVEVSGRIGVSASGGAKVERAEINLNQGYNIAAMGM